MLVLAPAAAKETYMGVAFYKILLRIEECI